MVNISKEGMNSSIHGDIGIGNGSEKAEEKVALTVIFGYIFESCTPLWFCKDVNFDCSDKGLQVQSMDSSHVALISLILHESAFSTTLVTSPILLDWTWSCCQRGANDQLELAHLNGVATVSFQCERQGCRFRFGIGTG